MDSGDGLGAAGACFGGGDGFGGADGCVVCAAVVTAASDIARRTQTEYRDTARLHHVATLFMRENSKAGGHL